MKAVLRAALAIAAIWSVPALAQVPPSNAYERQMLDINRSMEQRQRDIHREQQREFETNQRFGAPRTERMPGEPRPGCPVGSAGC